MSILPYEDFYEYHFTLRMDFTLLTATRYQANSVMAASKMYHWDTSMPGPAILIIESNY